MLGVYDYTVILTYISLWISIGGMMLSLNGHLDLAVLCLALSGLCDMICLMGRLQEQRRIEQK